MNDLKFTLPFTTKKAPKGLSIFLVKEKDYKGWLSKQAADVKALANSQGFKPGGKLALITRNAKGQPSKVFALVQDSIGIYDMPAALDQIKAQLSQDFIDKTVFELSTAKLKEEEITQALTGWALGGYQFNRYKAKKTKAAIMRWPEKANKKRVTAYARSIYMLRELINTPANDLGPAQLEDAARFVAKEFKAKISVTADKKLLEKNFPVIYTVGEAAADDRRPRLIDLSWGKKTDPKLTLVGKGVSFDTGGLNLKPGQYMKLMKKDMGGAAHALALGWLVMALNLPVNLRVLVPAVENSISGPAFRPSDIIKSRKGLFIENTNTDAEGRLILADSLTYACEAKPDLVIDFATLTGSARAALGEDIPAFFATDSKTAATLQNLSVDIDDPVWRMPLWQDYKRHVQNSNGDLVNSAGLPGDLIYSAIFLQQFMDGKTEWLHFDTFAWETSGRPGRAKGGKDTGLRSAFALLESRYGKKKK